MRFPRKICLDPKMLQLLKIKVKRLFSKKYHLLWFKMFENEKLNFLYHPEKPMYAEKIWLLSFKPKGLSQSDYRTR